MTYRNIYTYAFLIPSLHENYTGHRDLFDALASIKMFERCITQWEKSPKKRSEGVLFC